MSITFSIYFLRLYIIIMWNFRHYITKISIIPMISPICIVFLFSIDVQLTLGNPNLRVASMRQTHSWAHTLFLIKWRSKILQICKTFEIWMHVVATAFATSQHVYSCFLHATVVVVAVCMICLRVCEFVIKWEVVLVVYSLLSFSSQQSQWKWKDQRRS